MTKYYVEGPISGGSISFTVWDGANVTEVFQLLPLYTPDPDPGNWPVPDSSGTLVIPEYTVDTNPYGPFTVVLGSAWNDDFPIGGPPATKELFDQYGDVKIVPHQYYS